MSDYIYAVKNFKHLIKNSFHSYHIILSIKSTIYFSLFFSFMSQVILQIKHINNIKYKQIH